jgi:protein-disulfide isomerase
MMEKKKTGFWGFPAFAIALGAVLIGVGWLSAQEASKGTINNEERLIRRITEEVMNELSESDFLQREIEAGIERFIQKQQAQPRASDEIARKNVRPVSVTRDHIFGNPDAEISLIEYSDFECPYCKRFHPTAKEIVKSYAGRVNWVYRHFPLESHNPGAQKHAEASECAAELGGNNAFWEYTDRIYQRTRSNGEGFPINKLIPLAIEIGLDENLFTKCLDSGRHAARVQADFDNGVQSGVSGTPGNILLNNKTGKARFAPGALPLTKFKTEIDRLLER